MNIVIKLIFLLSLTFPLQAYSNQIISLPSGEYEIIGLSHLVNTGNNTAILVVKYMSSERELKNLTVMQREADELAQVFYKLANEKGYTFLIIRAYARKPKNIQSQWKFYNFLYEKKGNTWSKVQENNQ